MRRLREGISTLDKRTKGNACACMLECLCMRAVPSTTLISGFYASIATIITSFSWIWILYCQTVKKNILIFLWLSESRNLGPLFLAWYSHRWVYFWGRGSQDLRVNGSEILLWFDFFLLSIRRFLRLREKKIDSDSHSWEESRPERFDYCRCFISFSRWDYLIFRLSAKKREETRRRHLAELVGILSPMQPCLDHDYHLMSTCLIL